MQSSRGMENTTEHVVAANSNWLRYVEVIQGLKGLVACASHWNEKVRNWSQHKLQRNLGKTSPPFLVKWLPDDHYGHLLTSFFLANGRSTRHWYVPFVFA